MTPTTKYLQQPPGGVTAPCAHGDGKTHAGSVRAGAAY
jgi:hypothetical protein